MLRSRGAFDHLARSVFVIALLSIGALLLPSDPRQAARAQEQSSDPVAVELTVATIRIAPGEEWSSPDVIAYAWSVQEGDLAVKSGGPGPWSALGTGAAGAGSATGGTTQFRFLNDAAEPGLVIVWWMSTPHPGVAGPEEAITIPLEPAIETALSGSVGENVLPSGDSRAFQSQDNGWTAALILDGTVEVVAATGTTTLWTPGDDEPRTLTAGSVGRIADTGSVAFAQTGASFNATAQSGPARLSDFVYGLPDERGTSLGAGESDGWSEESTQFSSASDPFAAKPCDAEVALWGVDGSDQAPAAVAFLQFDLNPGASVTLPAYSGVQCSTAGSLQTESDPITGDPVFINDGTDIATLLVGMAGRAVRRLSIPSGVHVTDLGGATSYAFHGRMVRFRIDQIALAPGERLGLDAGADGALVIAVLSGEVLWRNDGNGVNAIVRHDGRPLGPFEQEALLDEEIGGLMVGAGMSVFGDGGAAGRIANEGDTAADVLVLTVSIRDDLGGGSHAGTSSTSDQPASPSSRADGNDVACDVEPLTDARVDAMLGRLTEADARALWSRPRFAPGDGAPATPQVAANIERTVQEFVACIREGGAPKLLSFFSVAMLGTMIDPAESIDDNMTAQPVAGPLDVRVWDIRTQPDGRVTAKVELDGSALLLTFEQDEGRWLIDDQLSDVIIEPAPDA